MSIKSIINSFYSELKSQLNTSLTIPIKSFNSGYQNLVNLPTTALLFIVKSSVVERVTTSRNLNIISASILVQITQSKTLQDNLLDYVDEFETFFFDNPHLGGVTQVAIDKWNFDTDETLSTGLLVFDLEIEI